MADRVFPGPVPAEVIDYIQRKDLRPGFSYRDVWGAEHAHGFTVAKLLKLDLLGDVQDSLAANAQAGATFRDWAARIRPEMEKKGWWGVKEMTDPVTGEKKEVQLGSARRLRTIYNSNMRAARASAQWQRVQRNAATHPYLLYQLGPSVHHRPQHVAWEGTLLPIDDPFWSEAYPPSGYGCKCWVRAVSRHEHGQLLERGYQDPLAPQEIDPRTGLPTGRKLERRKKVQTAAPALDMQSYWNPRKRVMIRVPRGVTPAWQGNVGARRAAVLRDALADKIDAIEWGMAHDAVRSIVDSPVLTEYLSEARAAKSAIAAGERAAIDRIGELAVGVVPTALKKEIGADTMVIRATPERAATSLDAPGLRRLHQILAGGDVEAGEGGAVSVRGRVGGHDYVADLRRDPSGRRLTIDAVRRTDEPPAPPPPRNGPRPEIYVIRDPDRPGRKMALINERPGDSWFRFLPISQREAKRMVDAGEADLKPYPDAGRENLPLGDHPAAGAQ